jgi:hypothetical protein
MLLLNFLFTCPVLLHRCLNGVGLTINVLVVFLLTRAADVVLASRLGSRPLNYSRLWRVLGTALFLESSSDLVE